MAYLHWHWLSISTDTLNEQPRTLVSQPANNQPPVQSSIDSGNVGVTCVAGSYTRR